MKATLRILLVIFAFVATYFFVFWVPFSLVSPERENNIIATVVSLASAVVVCTFLWKATGRLSNGLATSALIGGIIVGSIGFVVGFLGPIIIFPGSNQGPLFGIFISGPAGFVLGILGGGLYWLMKVKKTKSY